MSLRTKFLSVFAMILGVSVFSAMAQSTNTTTTPDKTDGTVKRERMGGKRFDHHRGMRGGFRFGGIRGVDLTDAQKAQIKSIREANKPDPAVMAELKAIHDARKAGTITDAQKARVQAIRDQQREKARSVHEQVMNVLTPEQKAQIETRKTEMRERFKNRQFDRPNRKFAPRVDKPKTI